jgi:hypothetical protein
MALPLGHYPLGDTYLNIGEFVNLHKARKKYTHHATKPNESTYFDAFKSFLDFMSSYADANVGGLTHDEAASKIYGSTVRQTKKIAQARLLAAKVYADEIRNQVYRPEMMSNVYELVTNLLSEFEDVLILSERLLYRNIASAKAYFAPDTSFQMTDVVSAANQLMFAYATKEMSTFDYRNTLPYVIVQVRQLIENIAFNSIGVERVLNSRGGVANGVITETLNFLIDSQSAHGYSIKFPVSPNNLHALYKWSCSFVHKGTLSSGYIIHYAFFLTKKLIEAPLHQVRIYTGVCHLDYRYGDIKIRNYNNLKTAYINKISPRGWRNIDWLPIENVGAYILSV